MINIKQTDNIIRKPNGQYYLLDFGICKQLENFDSYAPTPAGARLFMAPETLLTGASLKSDLYSLGVSLILSRLGLDGCITNASV